MNELLSRYPEHVDIEIKNKNIVLKTIPDNFQAFELEILRIKQIKNARQLHEYLLQEKNFWLTDITKNNSIVSSYPSYLHQALLYFDALVKTTEPSQTKQQLEAVLGQLSLCNIISKTRLAKTFIKFKDENANFFNGFKEAINGSNSRGYINDPIYIRGLVVGYGYIDANEKLNDLLKEEKQTFSNTALTVENTITELLTKAETEYHAQDKKYKELSEKSNNFINAQEKKYEEISEQANGCIKEFEKIIAKLEINYKEKLAFEDPAADWEALSKDYHSSGQRWLVFGIILSVVIVSAISLLIIFLPKLYETPDNWFYMARDTALLTVLVGVAIYALRIIFRLSISSFHLSRDAKERHRLTKFYHAMKEAELIREEERPLVIQALFSRSDTGLLKDTTPEMPTPVVDMINRAKE